MIKDYVRKILKLEIQSRMPEVAFIFLLVATLSFSSWKRKRHLRDTGIDKVVYKWK